MSPTIFGYVVLFTLLVAGAAAAVEWGTQGRAATRHFWTAAILLALLAPPAVLAWHAVAQRSVIARSSAASGSDEITTVMNSARAGARNTGALVSRDAPIRSILPSRHAAIAALSRWNQKVASIAITAWALLSIALIVWLTAGVFHWRRVQRAWRRMTLDGVDVDVSPLTGPAVLGFLSHRIVLPAWATTMQPEYRRLVLAHECEHISAADPQRLAFGIAALILMPWNVGLWWCAARLRRSIELDCDARVLRRFPNAKEYGYVLLEVAARGRNTGPLAIPMVGLLRLPSELELRLRAMTRPRSASAWTISAGSALALVAICAAFSTPVPTMRGAPSANKGRLAVLALKVEGERRGPESRADTVPKNQTDSVVVRKREIDSVNVLLRRVQEKSAALDRSRVQLELVTAELQSAEQHFSLPDSTRAAIEAARPHHSGIVTIDSLSARMRTLQAYLRQTDTDLRQISLRADSAITRYYPEIATHPDGRAVLWFVADSAGHVIETKRDDSFGHHILMADSVSTRFLDVNRASIASVSMIRKTFGTTNLTVTWTTLKGKSAQ